jgi:hypothetical protein
MLIRMHPRLIRSTLRTLGNGRSKTALLPHRPTEGILSMSEKKPTPLFPARAHSCCPVCGKISYSLAGVHPQCSVRRADEEHKNRSKREKLLAEVGKTAKPAAGISPWQKSCPQCSAVQHVRKTVCNCGYRFTVGARRPTSEGERP